MQDGLTKKEVERYSRQLLLPGFGVQGQKSLLKSAVLIVGAGGLGSPAALYLASSGIGVLGVLDYDDVEINNLHRQVIHQEHSVGLSKAANAVKVLQQLNSSITYRVHDVLLDATNALEIIEQYDIVLDCTDNMATRYLLNDACILTKKPLVSASALRYQGQLTIYNYQNGPCYRCLFPTPPSSRTVTNCSEAGVLGPIVGVMGSLQALQAIHILTNHPEVLSNKMLIFDGESPNMFRTIKLRPRNRHCVACGDSPSILHLIDYESFCGQKACDKIIPANLFKDNERISALALEDLRKSHHPFIIDVRPPHEYAICRITPSTNIPLSLLSEKLLHAETYEMMSTNAENIIVICHRGNDSQRALLLIHPHFPNARDVIGGYDAYAQFVDEKFPRY